MVHIMLTNVKTILFALCMVILSETINAEDIMTKLSPPDGAQYDWFGFAVSIYGEIAVIGSHRDDDMRGSAYLFARQSNGNWAFIQKIVASDGSDYDEFGFSVSVYEEKAFIGAWGNNSVYIFEKQINGTWTEIQKLTGSGGGFGYALSIYQDIAVIGAKYDGSVFVYQQQSNGQWVEWQKLTASDYDGYTYFGAAVDIYEDIIVVGAEDVEKGKAYVFEVSDNGTWIEISILNSSSDFFGHTVSVYGNVLIVGAYHDDTIASNAGAAYIYSKTDGDIWRLNQTLFASDATRSSLFGSSVSIYNRTIVIGAYWDGDNGEDSGSAYIFNKVSGGEWIETAKIIAFDGGENDLFGQAVSIHGNDILIGAYEAEDESVARTGAGYIMKNWNSCNEIWSESDDNEFLSDTTDRYLVNWQWTDCIFTTSPFQQPTANPTTLMEETEETYTLGFSYQEMTNLWLVIVVCILNSWALFMCHRYYKKRDAENKQDALP